MAVLCFFLLWLCFCCQQKDDPFFLNKQFGRKRFSGRLRRKRDVLKKSSPFFGRNWESGSRGSFASSKHTKNDVDLKILVLALSTQTVGF